MTRVLTSAFVLLILTLTTFGTGKDDAKTIWKEVLKKCAGTDLIGDKVLFFGLSNSSGPGTILRQRPDNEGGGYGYRWSLEDIEPSQEKWPQLFSKPPASPASCLKNYEMKKNVKAGFLLESVVAPITGALSADWSLARKTTVRVQSFAWDALDEGPFVLKIDSLPSESRIREDINRPDRFVVTRALRVKGIVADLEFAPNVAVSLQSKYKDQVPVKTGDATFNVSWTGSEKTILHLESQAESYVAGELSRYSAIGFSGTTSRFRHVDKPSSTMVVRDTP